MCNEYSAMCEDVLHFRSKVQQQQQCRWYSLTMCAHALCTYDRKYLLFRHMPCRDLMVGFFTGTRITVGNTRTFTFTQLAGGRNSFVQNWSYPGTPIIMGNKDASSLQPFRYCEAPDFPPFLKHDIRLDWRDCLDSLPPQWKQGYLDNINLPEKTED